MSRSRTAGGTPGNRNPEPCSAATFDEIEAATENPDTEPVPACAAAKTAIIVFGKRIGTTFTVCTDNHCPIHDPRAAARQAADPEPTMPPAPDAETDEEAEQRRAEHEQRRREYEAEQERKAEERRLEQEREAQEYEAEQARRHELRQAREATCNRILENAPAMFSAAQLRVLLSAIVNLDPYTFADDLAEDVSAEGEHEADHRSAEEVLLSRLDSTSDDGLTRFALRLALSGHRDIPRKDEIDFLTEADTVFPRPNPRNLSKRKRRSRPSSRQQPRKAARKSIAA